MAVAGVRAGWFRTWILEAGFDGGPTAGPGGSQLWEPTCSDLPQRETMIGGRVRRGDGKTIDRARRLIYVYRDEPWPGLTQGNDSVGRLTQPDQPDRP
jgi:hypothetical protein